MSLSSLGYIVLLVPGQIGISDLSLLPRNSFRFLVLSVIGIDFQPHWLSEIAETDLVVSELAYPHCSS